MEYMNINMEYHVGKLNKYFCIVIISKKDNNKRKKLTKCKKKLVLMTYIYIIIISIKKNIFKSKIIRIFIINNNKIYKLFYIYIYNKYSS